MLPRRGNDIDHRMRILISVHDAVCIEELYDQILLKFCVAYRINVSQLI